MKRELLKIQELSISFSSYQSVFRQAEQININQLHMTLYEGEIIAVIGASGSGKSLLAHAVLNLLPKNATVSGKISFKGQPISYSDLALLRGKNIAFIPQSINSLDPLVKIREQLLFRHKKKKKELAQIFSELDLDSEVGDYYPHELSGGMARRVLFATALLEDPDLFIADEPTPGMDTEQAVHALSILKNRVEKENRTVLLITHDIDLAIAFATRILVFFEGKIIDQLPSKDFEKGPSTFCTWHPFTKALWYALPQNGFYATPSKEFEGKNNREINCGESFF